MIAKAAGGGSAVPVVVPTPVAKPVAKVAPHAAAPVVAPTKVVAKPTVAPAPTVVPHAAAPAVTAAPVAPAPMTTANSANARESRTQNFISGGTGENVDLSAIGGKDANGNYPDSSYKANTARMAPILNTLGITGLGRVASTIASLPFDMAANEVGTTHHLGSLPIHNYYDVPNADGTISHRYKAAALESLPIWGGSALRLGGRALGAATRVAGTAVGKGLDSIIGRTPASLSPYEKPASESVSDFQMLANANKSHIMYDGPQYGPHPKPMSEYAPKSTGFKAKAAGMALAAAIHMPAEARVAQDALLPRGLPAITRSMEAKGGANLTTTSERQFRLAPPETVPVSGRAILTQTGDATYTAQRAAATAARADAQAAARDAAVTRVGTVAGALTSGHIASSIPDAGSRAVAIHNANHVNQTVNQTITQSKNVMTPNFDPASTTVLNEAPITHRIPNPYVTTATSITPVSVPIEPPPPPPTDPGKILPPIGGGMHGGSGLEDVYLKRMA